MSTKSFRAPLGAGKSTDILLPANQAHLARFVRSRVLLAFDFDGTLAPISAERDVVAMRPRTAQLLARACALFRCAVISGRSQADVANRLAGLQVPHIIGNHGVEPSDQEQRCEDWTARALPILHSALDGCAGIDIEGKRYSIAIHYREASSSMQALRAIVRAIALLGERPRVFGGKAVVNLTPSDAPHKGSALAALAAREGFPSVLYVGDDTTDEDVFENAAGMQLLGIRVGLHERSAAQYYVADQERVDDLLQAIVSSGADAHSLA